MNGSREDEYAEDTTSTFPAQRTSGDSGEWLLGGFTSVEEAARPTTRDGHGGIRPRLARTLNTISRVELSSDPRRKALAGIGLGALAVALVGGAFGIGRMFADNPLGTSGAEAAPVVQTERQAYGGPVNAVAIAGSSADCQAASSVDAAGNRVSYEPAKAHDSDLSTAWRCDGSGVGQRFILELPESTDVAEVGIVPGYAKTDPANGVDRYAENNRITRVRWHLGDGSTFVQRISPNPSDRSVRTMRIPVTETRTVVIEILRSKPGSRNVAAISEVRVAAPAGG